jgi:hypothetical protein
VKQRVKGILTEGTSFRLMRKSLHDNSTQSSGLGVVNRLPVTKV